MFFSHWSAVATTQTTSARRVATSEVGSTLPTTDHQSGKSSAGLVCVEERHVNSVGDRRVTTARACRGVSVEPDGRRDRAADRSAPRSAVTDDDGPRRSGMNVEAQQSASVCRHRAGCRQVLRASCFDYSRHVRSVEIVRNTTKRQYRSTKPHQAYRSTQAFLRHRKLLPIDPFRS